MELRFKKPNKSLLSDNFSTASRFQNCLKALRYVSGSRDVQ